jgi:t-SNARE complex subunit (syntaxin)
MFNDDQAEIQRDVNDLLNKQGEDLKVSEANSNKAKVDIETGVENTKKASEYLASYRCKIFIIIIILLVVAAIIIGIAVGVSQRNAANAPQAPPAAPPA